MLKWIEDVGIINPEDVTRVRYKLGRRRNARVWRPGPLMYFISKFFHAPNLRKPWRLGTWQDGSVIVKFRNGDDIEFPVKGGYNAVKDRAYVVLDKINAACFDTK